MKICKHCKRPLDPYFEKRNATACSTCFAKIKDARRFVEVCDEFKEIIHYEGILRKRKKEEAEK